MIEANSFIFNIKLIFYSKAFLRGGLAGRKLGGDSALKGGVGFSGGDWNPSACYVFQFFVTDVISFTDFFI